MKPSNEKAIPAQDPLYIGFTSACAALAYKENGAGGWIFVPDEQAGAIWFDGAYFTVCAVMCHPAAKGSGKVL